MLISSGDYEASGGRVPERVRHHGPWSQFDVQSFGRSSAGGDLLERGHVDPVHFGRPKFGRSHHRRHEPRGRIRSSASRHPRPDALRRRSLRLHRQEFWFVHLFFLSFISRFVLLYILRIRRKKTCYLCLLSYRLVDAHPPSNKDDIRRNQWPRPCRPSLCASFPFCFHIFYFMPSFYYVQLSLCFFSSSFFLNYYNWKMRSVLFYLKKMKEEIIPKMDTLPWNSRHHLRSRRWERHGPGTIIWWT